MARVDRLLEAAEARAESAEKERKALHKELAHWKRDGGAAWLRIEDAPIVREAATPAEQEG